MTNKDTYDIQEYEREQLYLKLMEITRWHADLQIAFYKELESEPLIL